MTDLQAAELELSAAQAAVDAAVYRDNTSERERLERAVDRLHALRQETRR